MDHKDLLVESPKVAEAKAYHEKMDRRKKRLTSPEKMTESFFAQGNKVLKKTTMPNGNVYTVYIGTTKQCDLQKIQYIR